MSPTAVTPDSRTTSSVGAVPEEQSYVWDLVERAQQGDTEAFGKIYTQYAPAVFRFIYFRVRHSPTAEDLTSDTFLRALKRIGSVRWQGRDFAAWLITIARHIVADYYKSGRYRFEITGEVLDFDQEEYSLDGAPDRVAMDHVNNLALLEAVKKLNPSQQRCIALRFLVGLSTAETAQSMGKSEGAVKALQCRAVRMLGRLLPDGFEESRS
ncbi:sigma-70 family RNA polymerase sigma factor [Catellatospora bangladeshensis]|uniref:RNA polymerase sigma factor n=1 Tax=Catellatospora bangladeshensis TaxID=310355 RepID=A0A8J3NHB8_9ACTN|nr:RNA polymerase sigma factor [Catellatospora bangladeshensis]